LFDKRKEQLKSESIHAVTEISQLQDYYKKTYPSSNLVVDVELSLFKSGKLIRGQIKYLQSVDASTSVAVFQIPPPSESNLGNYIFAQSGLDQKESSLTILSPVTKKCREIPVEGKGDQILLSGISVDDIFFGFAKERPFIFTNVLRGELLVPESRLIKDNELEQGTRISIESNKYSLKEAQLVNKKAFSPLYARPSELIHIDIKNGLLYQVQFLIDGSNKKGVILYSWMRLEDGTSIPKEISYYEEKAPNDFEIVSRLDAVGIKKSDVDVVTFKSQLAELCKAN